MARKGAEMADEATRNDGGASGLNGGVRDGAYRKPEAEIEQLKKDAARYRWLRDEFEYIHGSERPVGCVTNKDADTWLLGEKLDSAIDSVMANRRIEF